MNNEEKAKVIEKALEGQDIFNILEVRDINHKPHPYCITEKHIGRYTTLNRDTIMALEKEGKAHCGMYTSHDGKNYTNGYRAGWKKCTVPYKDHTHDNVAFLQLKRNATKDEAKQVLKDLVDTIGESLVDGFAFTETEEKFRIL